VYVTSARFGPLVRKFTPPRNPQTEAQQAQRQVFAAVASQWRSLTDEQRAQWCLAAALIYVVNRAGRQVHPSGYHYYMRINVSRGHLGLSRYLVPPTNGQPSFPVNGVDALVVEKVGATYRVKARVSGPTAELTLVQAAAPVSAGVSCVQQYRYVGLLPAAENGYSDITDLVIGRFGPLTPGKVLYIRTRQQIDGLMDVPRVVSAVIPSA
jgi:hypothetical protein